MPHTDPFLFVSHVTQDRVAAMEIVRELERRSIKCWIAPRDVNPGGRFDDDIADAIEASRAMLLVFSDQCNESEYIHREVTVAGETHKLIIPFRIENAHPRRGLSVRLSNLHWIDAFVERERAIDQLVQHLAAPKSLSPEIKTPPLVDSQPSPKAVSANPEAAQSERDGAQTPPPRRATRRPILVGVPAGAIALLAMYFYSSHLLRPTLSIEDVEVVATPPRVSLDQTPIKNLLNAQWYLALMTKKPALRNSFVPAGLDGQQVSLLVEGLSDLRRETQNDLSEAENLKKSVSAEADYSKIKAHIKARYGSLYDSFAFASGDSEQMKLGFIKQLEAESTEDTARLELITPAIAALRLAKLPIVPFKFKVSILNHGGTDGLVRGVGQIRVPEWDFYGSLLRVAAPTSSDMTFQGFAVPVSIANQPLPVSEGSVGRIDKHSVADFWFEVDEGKLSEKQQTILRTHLPFDPSIAYQIVLSSQENDELGFDSRKR